MSGGASKKQTNINFTPMSDDTSQEPRSDAETSDKDRAKRSRYEMENNDETGTTLPVPTLIPPPMITPTGSDNSLFDRDSIATIVGADKQPPNTSPRETNEFTNVDEGNLRPRVI